MVMKKGIVASLLVSVLIGNPMPLHIPGTFEKPASVIVGKVSPAEGADEVYIIRKKDTLRTAVVSGNFSQSVAPEVYRLIVEAKQPFRRAMLDNLDVKQDKIFDVGEIILQK